MIRALLALLLLFGAAACGEREQAPPSHPGKPALWAIEHRQGAVAGWLFGTIHALPDGAEWKTPELGRVVGEAGVLVVEVRELAPERVAAVLRRLASDDPGPPLAERLAPDARRDLAELLDRHGVATDRFDGLETWAAALAVSRLGGTASAANGADRALLRIFVGRPIAELEGAADQLAIFDALPERDQRSLLTAVLAEQDDPAADARGLSQAWLAGDMAALEQVTRRGLLADSSLRKALSSDRNRSWLRKIKPMLESGRKPLIAVGAAHMLGDDGLPALLEADGYRVRRLQ